MGNVGFYMVERWVLIVGQREQHNTTRRHGGGGRRRRVKRGEGARWQHSVGPRSYEDSARGW